VLAAVGSRATDEAGAVKSRPEVPGRWVAKVARIAPAGKASAVKSKKGGARSWESVMLFNEYQLTAMNIRPRIVPVPSVSSFFSCPPLRDPTGQSDGFQYLVLRDVGPDLLRLAGTEGGDAPVEAVAAVGHDMVQALRVLHQSCRLMHLDIKPDNICVTQDDEAVGCHAALIDFTTSCKARAPDGSRPTSAALGVHLYSSLRLDQRGPLTPSMDIDSLVFTLAYLCGCSPPWFTDPRALSSKAGLEEVRAEFSNAWQTEVRAHSSSSRKCSEACASLLRWWKSLPPCLAQAFALTMAIGDDLEDEHFDELIAVFSRVMSRPSLKAWASSGRSSSSGGAASSSSGGKRGARAPKRAASPEPKKSKRAASPEPKKSKGGRKNEPKPLSDEEDDVEVVDDVIVIEDDSPSPKRKTSPKATATPGRRRLRPKQEKMLSVAR
jgi:serine/threonine protein kinase